MVLSANHSGALRCHEALDEQFEHDSAPEFGWLQPVVCDKTPLVLQLQGGFEINEDQMVTVFTIHNSGPGARKK